MDQDTTPKGNEWDSEEFAIGKLTCDNASRFLAGFTAAFRAFAMARSGSEQITILKNVLAQQSALLASGALEEKEKEFVEQSTGMFLVSIGMAMVAVNSPVESQAMFKLASNGVRAMNELSKTHDLTKNHIDFHVRKGKEDGEIEIGCKAVPIDEMEQKMAASAVGKALNSINQEKPKE